MLKFVGVTLPAIRFREMIGALSMFVNENYGNHVTSIIPLFLDLFQTQIIHFSKCTCTILIFINIDTSTFQTFKCVIL